MQTNDNFEGFLTYNSALCLGWCHVMTPAVRRTRRECRGDLLPQKMPQ